MKTKIIILLTFFIFIGCENKNDRPNIDSALLEVTKKFPQLPKGGINHYQFVKSVNNGKYNFEIQLYSEADTIDDPQKIMIFINSKKECYAIPFFSNTYRDYWGFKNEEPLQNVKKVKTTFTKQYLKALQVLKLNKDDMCKNITNEILISLLNCDRVTKNNSSFLKSLFFLNNNPFLDTEITGDKLKQKLLRNYEEIIETNNTDVNFNNNQIPIGYLDYKNYRFYQVVNTYEQKEDKNVPGKVKITKITLQIKSYRYDSVVHMMSSTF